MFAVKRFGNRLENESLQRLLASIVVHATVCNAPNANPVVATSAMMTTNFPKRANTRINLNRACIHASKIWPA